MQIVDRKRLRITDHILGNDASYNPGYRKLHRRLVWAVVSHTAIPGSQPLRYTLWDFPFLHTLQPQYPKSSLPDNESRCLQKLKTVDVIRSSRHFLSSSSGILSYSSVSPATMTSIPITNRPNSVSAHKIE